MSDCEEVGFLKGEWSAFKDMLERIAHLRATEKQRVAVMDAISKRPVLSVVEAYELLYGAIRHVS